MGDFWDSRIGLTFTSDTADAIREAIAAARTQALRYAIGLTREFDGNRNATALMIDRLSRKIREQTDD